MESPLQVFERLRPRGLYRGVGAGALVVDVDQDGRIDRVWLAPDIVPYMQVEELERAVVEAHAQARAQAFDAAQEAWTIATDGHRERVE